MQAEHDAAAAASERVSYAFVHIVRSRRAPWHIAMRDGRTVCGRDRTGGTIAAGGRETFTGRVCKECLRMRDAESIKPGLL
jgi:hypothetical protein